MSKTYISPKIKSLVFNRANGRCEYCKSPAEFSTEPFSVEHILPRSKGGNDDPFNLALSCGGCNIYKSDRTEFLDTLSQKVIPLFNPRTMNFDDHFIWDETLLELVAQTAIGRVTIQALKLNRRQVRNLRRALLAIGEHPPQ